MQTLTIKVKDDFMAEFIKIIDTLKDNVILKKDKNLELDPYFPDLTQQHYKKFQDCLKVGF